MKGAGKITVVAGGLPVLAAWAIGIAGLPEAHRPLSDVLAQVLGVFLLILAWRFRRGRVAVAALAIALANLLVRNFLPDPAVSQGLTALGIILAIDLAVLVLVGERPITSTPIIVFIGVVIAQMWLVGFAAIAHSVGGGAAVPGAVGEFLTAPQTARLVFLISGVFIGLAFAARRGSFEGSLLWVLAAVAVALLGWRGAHPATLALGAAQLVLLIGLMEDSYRLAYHDDLTGLPGRRALNEAMRGLNGDYAIAMVDVDHFKRFNDRHGHASGDQALRMIANELHAVGGGGRAFRYGGEEFAVLFPGGTPAAAREPLEALRAAIESRKFALRAPSRPQAKPDTPRQKSRPPRRVTVTASIGVAGPNSRRNTPEAVLRAADRALYRAKAAGRNRVVAAGEKGNK